ncbi:MAG TPA: hypothetical protein VK974_00740 [Methylophilaceae bacterium]|nr:hypothetical protein [Methylophilaceae bacterium]
MTYAEELQRDRRFLILLALQKAADYRLPFRLLQSFLDSFGQKVSTDILTGELQWLDEQGLIKYTEEAEVNSAVLRTRGIDIVSGRATYPGVRKPLLGEI